MLSHLLKEREREREREREFEKQERWRIASLPIPHMLQVKQTVSLLIIVQIK